MFTSDKSNQFHDYTVIKDFGEDEDFFRLETPQGEVHLKKLPFQKLLPLPDSISCRVTGYDGPSPILVHNITRYVNEFYADGFSLRKEFDFKVVGKPRDNNGIYRLEDKNGLQFKLQENKTQFAIGQTVRCRFEFLDQKGYKLCRSHADSQLKMVTLRDIGRILKLKSWAIDKVERSLREIPELAKAMDELDNGHPTWIFSALQAVKAGLPRWFGDAVSRENPEVVEDILVGCRDIALYLLEGSGFLKNIKGQERSSLQSELTDHIELIDIYLDALSIIARGKQKKFIETLLDHLKEAGYIYHPNSQFAILMILFRHSPELVNSSLGNIFDTLMEWYPDTWKTEPFRQAFVEQLEYYINDTRTDIDCFLIPDTDADNEKIEKMLKAIAIQQSLATEHDNIDLRRNMSLFYRILSLLRRAKAETLLNKAFLTLMGVRLPVDFTWGDIKEPTMMMTRAAVDPPANAKFNGDSRFYLAGDLEVEINEAGITVARTDQEAMGQVPNGLLPWLGLQVNVNIDHAFNRAKIKSLDGHAEFWTEVETALFQPKEVSESHDSILIMPDIDDEVVIQVERVLYSKYDPYKVEALLCRTVDDHYQECEGIMRAEDLVSYNLHGVTIGAFRNDAGEPLKFKAVVSEIDQNDQIYFSLQDIVHSAIRDITYSGDKCRAVITKDNGRSYSAISEKGFGLYIKKDPNEKHPYRNGNVVLVTITDFDHNAVQSVVDEGPLDGVILNNARSLQNLLRTIAVNEDNNNSTLELDEDDIIAKEDLKEIIQALRYMAVSKSDNLLMSFDYLSYARILARIINDEELSAAIKAHKEILLQHEYYAKNKNISREAIEEITQMAPSSKLVQKLASKLLIVSSLGHPEHNDDLWKLAQSQANEAERELAQMVLSHNLLYDINHEDSTASAIKAKIAETLNVNSEQSNLKYYGSEGQYVEFKSSIVYPAQKGKSGISMADPDKQEYEILHIIAGFLNSTGGTLYIGVTDDHYERGLEEDFKFYKLDQSERNTLYRRNIKSLDNLANYLQGLIDSKFSLGMNAGDYAKTSIDDESVKGVVMVKIAPCPRVVYFDNKIFVRHGSKTTPILEKSEIDQFIDDRMRLFNMQTAESAIQVADNEQGEAAPSTPAVTEQPTAEAAIEQYKPKGDLQTSTLRPNILHEYIDAEHYVPASFYIRFVGDHDYVITKDEWSLDEEGDRLDLLVKADELDQWLLLVYEGEMAVKVPMRELQQKKINTTHSHYPDKKLIYACPVKNDEGLYSLHANSKGTIYERLTPIDTIAQGSMSSTPVRIMEAECSESPFWEIVAADRVHEHESIKSTQLKKSLLGSIAKLPGTTKITVENLVDNFYKH